MKRFLAAGVALLLFAGPSAAQVPGPAATQALSTGGAPVTPANPLPISPSQIVYTFSTLNTSTAQLGAGATFTGTLEAILNEQVVSILLTSDQPTTVTVNQYIDAAGVYALAPITVTAAANATINQAILINGNYIKISAQNTGGGATTTFNLNVAYGPSQSAVTKSGQAGVVAFTTDAITNPTSTLTSGTATAITATNNEIASSTTAGSIIVPSFAIATSAGGAIIPKLTMQTSATSGWGGTSIQVDLWRAAPTLTNGDGAVYLPATGSANYIGSYTCTLAQAGDGAYGECTPNAGQADFPKLASGTSIFWTAFSLSTVTKVSGQTFILTAAVMN